VGVRQNLPFEISNRSSFEPTPTLTLPRITGGGDKGGQNKIQHRGDIRSVVLPMSDYILGVGNHRTP
jgi:hypothetical protein